MAPISMGGLWDDLNSLVEHVCSIVSRAFCGFISGFGVTLALLMASDNEQCSKLRLWAMQLVDAINAAGGGIKFHEAAKALNMTCPRRLHDVLGVLLSLGFLRQESKASLIEFGCAQLSNSAARSSQDGHQAA